jgi:hypothetical protein
MNRVRLAFVSGLVMLSGLALGTSSAHAQAPAAQPVAPYYYGWGYNGWGYYYYPAPPAAPTYTGGFYSVPAPVRSSARASGNTPSTYREFGTGRNVYLAKPWLRPLQ